MNVVWDCADYAKKAQMVRDVITLFKPSNPSALQIARHIGGISRNAVIGVCYRNGIELPRKPSNKGGSNGMSSKKAS